MNAFLRGFAMATGYTDADADEQWAAYSRQLSNSERRRIERGGQRAGARWGKRYRVQYPDPADKFWD